MDLTAEPPVGSVAVIGSGISGIESALDLADSGYLVNLITRDAYIGGRMARLDKTFPTNDCAMCMLGPRMTQVQNHPNIVLHTLTDVLGLDGSPGYFTLRLRQRPRYIDEQECTACGDCEAVCPVVMKDQFNEFLGTHKAIHRPFPQAVPNKYLIEKPGVSPCRMACPSGVNIQGFVALIRSGKPQQAWELIREAIPFPIICGTVCTHPCERACQRGEVDEPLNIGRLKRYAGEYVLDNLVELYPDGPPLAPVPGETGDESVAVVGSGPAGLSAAYHLKRRGYRVTVFEALEQIGGMMRVGIPPYRLPRHLLDGEIRLLAGAGIEFRTGVAVGKDVTIDELLAGGYSAVVLSIGAHEPQRAGVPGEDRPGVLHGVSFLRQACLGDPPRVGARVAVVGGGNTAVDAARTAIRLDAESVTVLYRRTPAEMTALPEEVEEAEEEGVEFRFLVSPVAVVGSGDDGPASAIRLIRNELGEPDAGGRRRPLPVPGSESELPAETIIFAISQAPDRSTLDGAGLARTRRGTVDADPITLETNRPGVFAAGDAVSGPATVIEALASGKSAALSVHRYLRGMDLAAGRSAQPEPEEIPRLRLRLQGEKRRRRERPQRLAPASRRRTFDEVIGGLSPEQALSESQRCLSCGGCSECLQCVAACPKHAVVHDQVERDLDVEVGAVIVASGFGLLDMNSRPALGYGIWPDVVTSVEFERMLSATGPWQGHVVRPSDGREPRRVAFIQCAGSRESREALPLVEKAPADGPAPYCSGICCMYTAKQAYMLRDHLPGCEVTVFHHDLRAVGKGFERYLQWVQDSGVRYVRSIPSVVRYRASAAALDLAYSAPGDGAGVTRELFDMVVLACGVRPDGACADLAGSLGIGLDAYGFVETIPGRPVTTTREGVLVAGGAQRPLDIPESVTSGAGAAAEAAAMLALGRGQMTRSKDYPPQRDVSGEPPRVGVFVCRCGANIGSVIDVPAVVAAASRCPGVVVAEERMFACSQESLAGMRAAVAEKGLNRILVASCTVRTHLSLFREAARESALNEFLVEMCNIREQCSWVHHDDPAMATAKAIDLVKMGAAKVSKAEPLAVFPVPVLSRAMVLGAGLAGLTAADFLARQGFEVELVEKSGEPGGNLARMPRLAAELGIDLGGLIERATGHPKVRLHTRAELTGFSGRTGHFRSTIRHAGSGEETEVEYGALIIATGAAEHRPHAEYPALGVGDPAGRTVVTRLEFEGIDPDALADDATAVFVQCAGGRSPERNYCSRTCCTGTMRNALLLKRGHPGRRAFVLYRDIRTYGKNEELYLAARNAGVLFVRYDQDAPPAVVLEPGASDGRTADRARVTVRDQEIGAELAIPADLVVLAAPLVPQEDARKLGTLLKAPADQDGFFAELHPKLAPLDLPSQGIYLCGLAHGPKAAEETIIQAMGAAARAATILSKSELMVGGIVATVDAERCAACLTCVRVCPYEVPVINEDGVAVIDPVECRGCGTCAAECPGKAIQLPGYRDDQFIAMVRALGDLMGDGGEA